jgi:hypothetical protein
MPYVRPGSVNRVIANDWNDLTDGAIALAIFHDEEGNPVNGAGNSVWTATATDGTYLEPSCGDWTNPGAFGRTGVVGGAGANWTSFATASCGSMVTRLYCFQK